MKISRAASVFVEIGCYEGATTAAVASKTAAQVFSIDLFPAGRLGISYGYWIAKTAIKRLNLSNVHLIKSPSHEAAKAFDLEVDVVFIDGDHSEGGIETDWADWFPKVKVGGVIAIHDCRIAVNSPVELGTMKFYRRHIKHIASVEEVEEVDSLVVLRKLASDGTPNASGGTGV